MPIIEIDKSVLEEIENIIERKNKMYENQIAVTKKLTDGIEKLYEQEVKKLRKQLQQKENIIKEVREKIENTTINCDGVAEDLIDDIYEILDKVSDE